MKFLEIPTKVCGPRKQGDKNKISNDIKLHKCFSTICMIKSRNQRFTHVTYAVT